jgi:hypothetical protein
MTKTWCSNRFFFALSLNIILQIFFLFDFRSGCLRRQSTVKLICSKEQVFTPVGEGLTCHYVSILQLMTLKSLICFFVSVSNESGTLISVFLQF